MVPIVGVGLGALPAALGPAELDRADVLDAAGSAGLAGSESAWPSVNVSGGRARPQLLHSVRVWLFRSSQTGQIQLFELRCA